VQPVTELAGLVLGMVAVGCAGIHWSWTFLPLCLGLGILPAIASIDLAYGIIPDMLNGLLALSGLIWLAVSGGDVFLGLICSAGLLAFGLFLALFYSKWRKKEMLGLGDVKFFAAAGLWLPALTVPWFLALAGLLGVAIGLIVQKIRGEKEFPFAPALCLSLAACVLYGVLFPIG
jgi:prepilin signal peptidase PulO-like enzyme (type II secretory pathway)